MATVWKNFFVFALLLITNALSNKDRHKKFDAVPSGRAV